MKELKELLPFCTSEDDVKTYYSNVIQKKFPNCIFRSVPHSGVHTDGIIEVKKLGLKILRELKYKKDISERRHLIDCIIQILYYLKLIEFYGYSFPNIIFIGNENYCYCFHSDIILPYLDEDINWLIAPSSAARNNPVLHNKLMNDTNINPYLFTIGNINFKEVIDTIKSLNIDVERKIMLHGVNINRFFHEFIDRVLINPKKYFNANEVVNIFINTINDPKQEHTYPHSTQRNVLVTQDFKQIRINRGNFDSFFSHVSLVETITDQKKLDAICDRLIEDLDRRFKGEFYTPTIWALEAHKMISEIFGPNWYNEYVVWDPAWGTGNLTRDLKFKELYCSTINESDLGIANARKYNLEAVKFQYDFLNDDVYPEGFTGVEEDKLERLAPGLVKAFKENRPIIIFMNPPFGTASPYQGEVKGLTKTRIKEVMKLAKQGFDGGQLYIQFLYRIIMLKERYKLDNINIVTYSLPTLISSSSYSKFRKYFYKNFKYSKGFLFNSKHFSDVSDSWGILLSIWKSGNENRSKLQIEIKDLDNDLLIRTESSRNLYRSENNVLAKDWAKTLITINEEDAPQLSTGINIKEKGEGKICKNSIGYFQATYRISDIRHVVLFSSCFSIGRGFSIIDENFYRCIALFTAQRSTIEKWFSIQDEFLKPNELHLSYKSWNNDCIIYSLFNNNSYQSSLRNIKYKNKLWNIKNEFFWMSNKQIQDLANQYGNKEIYQDSITFNQDRFIYNGLQKTNLSNDAQIVLNKATELVIKSFSKREELHWIHPEYHLKAWDAGWYQIKIILKEYFKDDLEEFKQLYKSFEDRMREGVYKFGFLK